jgi:transposase InsO family protein
VALQKQIRELQRVLGKKTLENEILREARKSPTKKLISRLRLGLVPCFTPPRSPQLNGMAEAFGENV